MACTSKAWEVEAMFCKLLPKVYISKWNRKCLRVKECLPLFIPLLSTEDKLLVSHPCERGGDGDTGFCAGGTLYDYLRQRGRALLPEKVTLSRMFVVLGRARYPAGHSHCWGL